MKPFLHSPRSGAHHSARSAALHSAATPPPFIRAAGAPFILCAALCALAPRASAQCAAQSIALRPGWNAVYVEVSPEEDAGEAEPPSTARQALRISSAVLPTETPVVEASSSLFGDGVGFAVFRFAVAADGATSLLRHPYHPQHDGLRWDFKTAAPSGDDFDNYKGEVKPELFSVENRIDITLDLSPGAAQWDPQNTVSGQCAWTFAGLRREGPLVATGLLTLTRVSPLADIVLE